MTTKKISSRSSVGLRPRALWSGVFAAAAIGLAPAELSAQAETPAVADTVAEEVLRRSPRGAFVRSLVVPGWGQAWVGSPGRGGVYFALEAGSLWMVYKSRQKLNEARRDDEWQRTVGLLGQGQPSALTRSREDQVEDWITLSIFLLFFSAADAFVAAHLADFGEHVGVLPTADGRLRLYGRVPVRGRR